MIFTEHLSTGQSPYIPIIRGPSFAYYTGRPTVGYIKYASFVSTAMVARDANGDGDFADAGELQTLGTLTDSRADGGDLALDAVGRAAYAYLDSGAGILKVAYDRNGDGDFTDTGGGNPEMFNSSTGSVSCFGL